MKSRKSFFSHGPSLTVGEWTLKAEDYLARKSVPEVSANIEFLLASELKIGRNDVHLQRARALTAKQGSHFWHLIEQRGRRIPLAYVLGHQPFLGLDIEVHAGALIPRPETEEVVVEAIGLLKPRSEEPLHLLEIGTGTGCIAIALSVAFPRASIYATDISPEAISLALKNAEAHHRSRHIRFISEDLFRPDAVRQSWADLVISNPPYIPTSDIDGLEPEVLKEPRLALDGGKDGLDAIRAIISAAPRYIKPGGFLVLEIGSGQGGAVLALLAAEGFKETTIKNDAQGHGRIAVGKW